MKDPQPRLLIICPSMWPRMRTWGETQRMFYLANDLSKSGWEVFTLSPDFSCDTDLYSKSGCFSSYFPNRCSRKKQDAQERIQENGTFVLPRFLQTLVAHTITPIVKWLYNEPDCYEGLSKQLWIWKNRSEIRRLLREINYDVLIISAPSFVLFRFAEKVKKINASIPVILDYRDPWHLWNRKKNFAYLTEKRRLRYADAVVGFSEIFAKDMEQVFHLPKGKCRVVYNGYSEADWSAAESRYAPPFERTPGKLYLVFTGNLSFWASENNYRNPFPLIETVRTFPDAELYFVGIQGRPPDIYYDNVHFIGNVSQETSFHYMLASDILISIHDAKDDSGTYLVSGKFYDYMRSGRVIWHIGRPQDLMSDWIRRYQLGITCSNDPSGLKASLELLIQEHERDRLHMLRKRNMKLIKDFSREMQNSRYETFLRSIYKNKRLGGF